MNMQEGHRKFRMRAGAVPPSPTLREIRRSGAQIARTLAPDLPKPPPPDEDTKAAFARIIQAWRGRQAAISGFQRRHPEEVGGFPQSEPQSPCPPIPPSADETGR